MRRRVQRVLIALVIVGLAPRAAIAQWQAGIAVERDRATWHFENPSAFDTAVLVPHSFEQYYVLDNLWVDMAASYRAGTRWRTAFGATPVREALATDYDTFHDPGSVVWVSGTTGNARVHSIRFAQELQLDAAGGLTWTGGYRLRVDVADFLDGTRTDVRNGIEVVRRIVSTPEHTTAQTHELFVAALYRRTLSGAWTLRAAGSVAPAAINRLAIQLPEKYPGQTLVFRATTGVAEGRAELGRDSGRWPLAIAVTGGRSWKYGSHQWVSRSHAGLEVRVGRTW